MEIDIRIFTEDGLYSLSTVEGRPLLINGSKEQLLDTIDELLTEEEN